MLVYSKGTYLEKYPNKVLYKNIKVKVGGGMNTNSELLNNNLFTTFIYIYRLDQLIDSKIKLFKQSAKYNKNISNKYDWLKKWNRTTRKEKMRMIYDSFIFENIEEDKSEVSRMLFECYNSYFSIIESETNEHAKFEEMFNVIIQLPIEICEALGIYKKFNMKSVFLDSSKVENNNYVNLKESYDICTCCCDDLPLAS